MRDIKIIRVGTDGEGERKEKSTTIHRRSSIAYREALAPKKGEGRLKVDPNLPKTLTPRGYADYTLKMSIASKKYESLVGELQRTGELWEDPDFPANDNSIGIPEMKGKISWMRPKDINPNGDIFKHEVNRFDIEQGVLSDCWLLAVLSSISLNKSLFHHVLPEEQSMHDPGYVGVFRARFWRFGEWVEVMVDDRIPVTKYTRFPCFMHSEDNDEFWSALAEKAYAKLCGCYGHLSGGHQIEAMEDLTGGLGMTFPLEKKNRDVRLPQHMLSFSKTCCLMGCTTEKPSGHSTLVHGIIGSHAYSITGVTYVKYKSQSVLLVRCRNPWGGNYEWTGPWSDNASEWNYVSQEERDAIGLKFAEDGEFWMSYDDFSESFCRLEVCHLGMESLEANESVNGQRRMEEAFFCGKWEKKISAGGCINNRDTFWMNPQFRITLTQVDPSPGSKKCTIYVGVMQKDIRKERGAQFHVIGFMIYKVPSNQATILSRSQILNSTPVVKSTFQDAREVSGRFKLAPGNYVIIPSTFNAGEEAQFIVRVLTFSEFLNEELDEYSLETNVSKEIIEGVHAEDAVLSEDQDMEEQFEHHKDPITQSITASVLRKILNNSSLQDINGFEPFNIELCRSMVAAEDVIFITHDEDGEGVIKDHQYRQALTDAGYTVSNELFSTIVHRYREPEDNGVTFSDFILCLVRLKYAFATIEAHPKARNGEALFHPEDYLRFNVCI